MIAPKISIKNLIKAGWDKSNTSGLTPSFSTGWYDMKAATPQITFTDPVEVAASTGKTGFLGIVTGGKPSQYWDGTVAVNLWVTREALATAGVNPKAFIFAMRAEVKRILQAGYNSISDLDFVSWLGGFEQVDATEKPVVYRFVGEVAYAYMD